MSHCSRLLFVTCVIYLGVVPGVMQSVAAYETSFKTRHETPQRSELSHSRSFSTVLNSSEAIAPSPLHSLLLTYSQASSEQITAQSSSSPSSATEAPAANLPRLAWLSLLLIPLAVAGGIFYGIKLASGKGSQQTSIKADTPIDSSPSSALPSPLADSTPDLLQTAIAASSSPGSATEMTQDASLVRSPAPTPLQETTRLSRVDIVETLIRDLHSLDPTQRRKAIWELGQRGDSRAIQPLVDLLMDSDSSQRSLILAAISEIGIHTLKPMNRALMMSLQDDSPDVRKNAIRDMTRLSDLVAQMSQLLQYAASDTDAEVRSTAQWALTQLNRIRALPEDSSATQEGQDSS